MHICHITWAAVSKGWICHRTQFLAGKERHGLEAKIFLLKTMLKNNFSVLFHKQGRECGTAAHKHLDNAAVHLQGYNFNLYYELNKDTKVAQGFSFALI